MTLAEWMLGLTEAQFIGVVLLGLLIVATVGSWLAGMRCPPRHRSNRW